MLRIFKIVVRFGNDPYCVRVRQSRAYAITQKKNNINNNSIYRVKHLFAYLSNLIVSISFLFFKREMFFSLSVFSLKYVKCFYHIADYVILSRIH